MIENYIPVLLHILIAVGFASVTLLTGVVLGRVGRRNATKDSAYECGVPSPIEAQPRFSIKFYLVAMLFILFDIEIVFMYPWAVSFRRFLTESGSVYVVFMSMLSFVTVLMIAYIYALKKGVLSWNR